MPADDAIRWDQRYRNNYFGRGLQARAVLVDHLAILPHRGLALDLAMGLGSNANCLNEHGLDVIGIDISFEAARRARSAYPKLQVVCADLTEFLLPQHKFDVILNFYYLQRNLLTSLAGLLKPGGTVILETLTTGMQEIRPDLKSDFLLKPGEILSYFSGWKILYHWEGWTESDHGKMKSIASLVAQTIPGS